MLKVWDSPFCVIIWYLTCPKHQLTLSFVKCKWLLSFSRIDEQVKNQRFRNVLVYILLVKSNQDPIINTNQKYSYFIY